MNLEEMKDFFKESIFEEMQKNIVLWIAMADTLNAPRKKIVRKMMRLMTSMASEMVNDIEKVEMIAVNEEELKKQMEEIDG